MSFAPKLLAISLPVLTAIALARGSDLPQPPPAIEQAAVDSAMNRLSERIRARASEILAPASNNALFSEGPYSLKGVLGRKLDLIRRYDRKLCNARLQLRRGDLHPENVRDLAREANALSRMPLDKLRDLMIEADTKNAQRLDKYRQSFGELPNAARTTTFILMKAGLIDTASPLPEDPLTEEIEQAKGIRRAYYQFVLPSKEGTPRRHNGYVEFKLSASQGLWLPTWADLDGDPVPLFDAEAFVPLRPYDLAYDGEHFLVAQQTIGTSTPLVSLLAPANPLPGRNVMALRAFP